MGLVLLSMSGVRHVTSNLDTSSARNVFWETRSGIAPTQLFCSSHAPQVAGRTSLTGCKRAEMRRLETDALDMSPAKRPASRIPKHPQHKQDISGSVSPRPRQEGPDEHSRCNTPQQPVAEFPPGLESLMQAAWQVPFPDSSIIGRSPRGGGACTADSSHSDGSNANLRDFGLNGADSPPWSPRRVPPAHVWGEGPPRAPGYRSGGACYPITSPGVSAANLVEAACELHALLQRRSAAGLGPLVGADGSLGTPDDPTVHPCPGKGVGTTAEKADTAAAEQLPPRHTPSPGPDRCCAAAFPPFSNGAAAHLPAAAARLGSPQGLKRPAAWQCANDSQLSFADRIDAEVADEVLSSMRPHQRWASAPPVQERHPCAELADDSY
ncbi:hypothetical protein WJX75_003804 [Coccomyxa subellipsoidea]|uniref:Uncharacterized protein n=1 Tax=Coccomyxa subellipsoidea TaxID=248742 RepID=A0ABR2YE25_9CHLO